MTAEPVEAFPPTLREVMLRPRWLALLALCLAVAGVFAWLGQWQLGRAIETAPVTPGSTEQVRPIDEVAEPGRYLTAALVGQRVAVSGSWVPQDFIVVSSRLNEGESGFWVTGQLRVADAGGTPTALAVAVGWSPSRDGADAAASTLNDQAESGAVVDLVGRLIPDEGPVLPPRSGDPQEQTRMSPAALLGRWHDTAGLAVYRQFLVSADPAAGLTAISAPAPDERSGVNWLNLFYAAEWAVFAGFAFYLWYRLARDTWEREVEDLEDATAGGKGPGD